jgi:nucleoid-associated protein YgaU
VRLLFGILILLTLFSAAALWQRSWTKEARSSREPFPSSVQEPGSAANADGWSRVVLGRPSGGAPYEVPPASVDEGPAKTPHGDRAAGPIDDKQLGSQPAVAPSSAPNPTPVQPAKDAVLTVQAGQTLSEICRDRYGTARLELVLALARYNRMAGPDELREGQEILLPALESLGENR